MIDAGVARERYQAIVKARRRLQLPGFVSFTEAGLDGPWVTPYQIGSRSETGPVLLTYNYLDAPSVQQHRAELLECGYLASMPFNRVLDLALKAARLDRGEIYVTHVFQLLPATRSAAVPMAALDASFDSVTRHELVDRRVIALGRVAVRACLRHGIAHLAVPHLSARGLNYATRAAALAGALRQSL